MKLNQVFFTLGILVLSACSCNSEQGSNNASTNTEVATDVIYERLNVPDFQTKLAATIKPQLVDVRTPGEFANGNIDGAVNINIKADDFLQNINNLDKKQPVFVYCQAGGRSKRCAKKMKSLGFLEIYELKTGYSGWEQ
ncbi:MAG: rhodanese-related sulfurtransferase [Paraglaciecola sp.]|jgi:rhodanese-related sulfurtransferase